MPGTAALDLGGFAELNSVSCASAGNCAAGGDYADGFTGQPFVVDETNGTWSKPIRIPRVPNPSVASVSCTSAGNCAAGGSYGYYLPSARVYQPFVVAEEKGKWGTPVTVRDLPGLNDAHPGLVTSVSCAGEGNCAAVGWYPTDYDAGDPFRFRSFVVTDRSGVWGRPRHLPGLGPSVQAYSVSCARAGNCTIGGNSSADIFPSWSTIQGQAFVTAP